MFQALVKVKEVLKKDPWILVFGSLPPIISLIMFYFLGNLVFGNLLTYGKEQIEGYLTSSGWSTFFYWLIAGFLTAVFFLLVNWFFFLIVSIIASPFNDLISSRTERVISGQNPESINDSISVMLKNFVRTILTEVKKVLLIIIVSLIALVLSAFPLFAPVGAVLSSHLMAASFLDYSWSRHNMGVKDCVSHIKGNLFIYTICGAAFLLLVSVPLVNILILPFGAIFFTILFHQNKRLISE